MICRTMLQIKPVLKTLPTAHSQQITTAITANNHLGKQSPKKGFVFFAMLFGNIYSAVKIQQKFSGKHMFFRKPFMQRLSGYRRRH